MKIIASNFKTNHTRKSTLSFCEELEKFITQKKAQNQSFAHQIALFPPQSALLDNHFKSFQIGAQNAYPTQNGSYTGEIGLEQLAEFGIQTLLIGHSERREILKESQSFCAEKFKFFSNLGFKIYYCIGESQTIKQQGNKAVLEFLESQLEGIDLNYSNLVIAYEPIWAIGSGVSATLEEITQIHTHLKQKLGKIPLLYGGSVKPQNVREILSLEGVDGVLVGSASWEISSFCQILENSL
ncbi:triose-phosphate isomerase [Helicobacter sp. MIT 11-5569]|uniref:triose-phosphate isomerase n=1 Tax=Helicobacter sp. MIT 11-5569 TaxID=1548151 RepID=UPI00051F881B|nr:triose-phosphate isomerase [Helicobacter sp. MIT 11-5569]TLD84524.1 triose-phosphate isomerase [Helicobacter sp. MIT 11-5569]